MKLLAHLLWVAALAGLPNIGYAQNAPPPAPTPSVQAPAPAPASAPSAGQTSPSASSSSQSDPTRPPAVFTAPAADAMALPAPVGFQAVILRKGAGKMALINGETVPLGGKVGEARLIGLSETEAVLDGPEGRQVMRLTPDIEKKIKIVPKTTAKRSKGRAKHAPKKISLN